ncbi:hypothetical protein N7462_006905 [Penicillium macrosclerotiorum]|uniref:uncharacterized protein n=1 Tax=Penicillium macrosclerotiorum TaxID=303699 RepID=UPI002547A487|nr:uncharacterized protein N7462_006905 [Penicillium macrosclerotiorum]KAJ5678661.1 hypothetical protein N7462_006905 [Penicillium macrosclerotiorum]
MSPWPIVIAPGVCARLLLLRGFFGRVARVHPPVADEETTDGEGQGPVGRLHGVVPSRNGAQFWPVPPPLTDTIRTLLRGQRRRGEDSGWEEEQTDLTMKTERVARWFLDVDDAIPTLTNVVRSESDLRHFLVDSYAISARADPSVRSTFQKNVQGELA